MTECLGLICNVAVTTGTGVGGVACLGTGRISYNRLVAVLVRRLGRTGCYVNYLDSGNANLLTGRTVLHRVKNYGGAGNRGAFVTNVGSSTVNAKECVGTCLSRNLYGNKLVTLCKSNSDSTCRSIGSVDTDVITVIRLTGVATAVDLNAYNVVKVEGLLSGRVGPTKLGDKICYGLGSCNILSNAIGASTSGTSAVNVVVISKLTGGCATNRAGCESSTGSVGIAVVTGSLNLAVSVAVATKRTGVSGVTCSATGRIGNYGLVVVLTYGRLNGAAATLIACNCVELAVEAVIRNLYRSYGSIGLIVSSTEPVVCIVYNSDNSLLIGIVCINGRSSCFVRSVNVSVVNDHVDVSLRAANVAVHVVTAIGSLEIYVDSRSGIGNGVHIVAVHCTVKIVYLAVVKVTLNHTELVSSAYNGINYLVCGSVRINVIGILSATNGTSTVYVAVTKCVNCAIGVAVAAKSTGVSGVACLIAGRIGNYGVVVVLAYGRLNGAVTALAAFIICPNKIPDGESILVAGSCIRRTVVNDLNVELAFNRSLNSPGEASRYTLLKSGVYTIGASNDVAILVKNVDLDGYAVRLSESITVSEGNLLYAAGKKCGLKNTKLCRRTVKDDLLSFAEDCLLVCTSEHECPSVSVGPIDVRGITKRRINLFEGSEISLVHSGSYVLGISLATSAANAVCVAMTKRVNRIVGLGIATKSTGISGVTTVGTGRIGYNAVIPCVLAYGRLNGAVTAALTCLYKVEGKLVAAIKSAGMICTPVVVGSIPLEILGRTTDILDVEDAFSAVLRDNLPGLINAVCVKRGVAVCKSDNYAGLRGKGVRTVRVNGYYEELCVGNGTEACRVINTLVVVVAFANLVSRESHVVSGSTDDNDITVLKLVYYRVISRNVYAMVGISRATSGTSTVYVVVSGSVNCAVGVAVAAKSTGVGGVTRSSTGGSGDYGLVVMLTGRNVIGISRATSAANAVCEAMAESRCLILGLNVTAGLTGKSGVACCGTSGRSNYGSVVVAECRGFVLGVGVLTELTGISGNTRSRTGGFGHHRFVLVYAGETEIFIRQTKVGDESATRHYGQRKKKYEKN